MTERWWYVRRGVAWHPVLGCCAGAAVTGGVLHRWPSTALLLLPVLLACCAAAAAFLFDEPPVPVVAVTPRGATWRRTARLGVAVVPLGLWCGVVWWRPGDLPLARAGWWLMGVATITLAAGIAAVLSRRGLALPGPLLAAVLVLAVIGPAIATGFVGVATPYPIAGFPTAVHAFWLGVAAIGGLVCAAAVRPGVRS
jgi:hypothetical protein